MNSNLALIGFYHPVNYFQRLMEAGLTRHWQVHFFPLFKYAYDVHDRLPTDEYVTMLINFLQQNDIRIILWVFLEVGKDVIERVIKGYPQGYFVAYNIDDPYNTKIETIERLSHFHLVVTPNPHSHALYKAQGVKRLATHIYPGDPDTYHPLKESVKQELLSSQAKYQYCPADISMYCETTLDMTEANRAIVDQIIAWSKERDWSVRIFGCPQLQTWWPDHYKWEPSSPIEINLIYNCAKIVINLSAHPRVINRHQMDILACGQASISNYQQLPLLQGQGVHCLMTNHQLNLEHQIINYLESVSHKFVRRRLALEYSWKTLMDAILHRFVSDNFRADLCRKLYQPRLSSGQTELQWAVKRFKRKGLYCWNWSVPDSFKHKEYRNSLNLGDNPPTYFTPEWSGLKERLYLHWKIHCRDTYYLKKSGKRPSGGGGGPALLGIADTCERTIEGLHIIATLTEASVHDKKQMIEQLRTYLTCNPGVDVNRLIETYFQIRLD